MLVVEDDASLRRSIQMLLQGRGFQVRAFAGADPMLLDERLDEAVCLVADYRLGNRDGVELLHSLRARGWQGPAILITAYSSDMVRRSAEQAGFAEIIEKPLKERVLVNTVARLTNRQLDESRW
ncbi:MAG: response regulator [Sphingomonadales bacterium]|nr:response regulator [Sphingomonadales bacterium]